MILHVARNASYLCDERAYSQSGGHLFLTDQIVENGDKPPTLLTNNRSIHNLYHPINTVMSSAAEDKIGATFLNVNNSIPIRTTLKEIGHP